MSPIKDILVLHHSHLDLGYTHSQPVMRELQIEYINQALKLLDDTADWPELSRPKWTCEVTEPVIWWLEQAQDIDINRFRLYLQEGRLAISTSLDVGSGVLKAWMSTPGGREGEALPVSEGKVDMTLQPRRVTWIRLKQSDLSVFDFAREKSKN